MTASIIKPHNPATDSPATATAEDHRLARLAAAAVALHLLETSLPSPLPGVKPGLANIITLAILARLGWRAAAWVTVLRVLAGALLYGTLLTPTFLLSAGGATAGLAVLGLLRPCTGRLFGAVGHSMLAATAHLGTQLVLVYLLFLPYPGLPRLAPLFLSAALVFGIINGLLAGRLLAYWKPAGPPAAAAAKPSPGGSARP